MKKMSNTEILGITGMILLQFQEKNRKVRAYALFPGPKTLKATIYGKGEPAAFVFIKNGVVNIGLEKGDVNEYIELAEDFAKEGLHSLLWLRKKGANEPDLVYDSNSPKSPPKK